jgi:hypothetical protein
MTTPMTTPAGAGLSPVLQLGATKSSHRWAELPGNWDRLNTRALYRSDNPWGIPTLPAATLVPARLVPYHSRPATRAAARPTAAGRPVGPPAAAVHFFLDDYRFEVVWSKPERGLARCCSVGAALAPDFSLWTDMPKVMQQWQVYRSRWCAAWMLTHGITVIPTISWSTPDSYPYAFAGITAGSVVAVSTVGTWRDAHARALFTQGLTTMAHTLHPHTVLIHGRPPTEQTRAALPPGTRLRCYPSHWHPTTRSSSSRRAAAGEH